MVKGRLVDELNQEELSSNLTPEQKLTKYVSFVLKYIREAYHPHVIVQSKGYNKEEGVITLKVCDDIIINSCVTVQVSQDLKLNHQMLEFYTPTQLRVLKEFFSCWNKVVM